MDGQEATQEATQQEATQEQESGQTTGQDWEARLEKVRADSRKWEARAKANTGAAKELEQLKAQSAETIRGLEEKLRAEQEKASKLEATAAEAAAAAEHSQALARVSAATGVPAELIAGSTEEEMKAHAEKVAAFASNRPAAAVRNPGGFPRDMTVTRSTRESFRHFFNGD